MADYEKILSQRDLSDHMTWGVNGNDQSTLVFYDNDKVGVFCGLAGVHGSELIYIYEKFGGEVEGKVYSVRGELMPPVTKPLLIEGGEV